MHTENVQTILLIAPVMDTLLARLDSEYVVLRLYEQQDIPAFLATQGSQVQAVVTRGDIGITNDILAQLPQVGIIAVFGVGTDAIDLNYVRSRDIAVTITSGVLTNDVADLAIGLLISGARRLCKGDTFVREGRWPTTAPILATSVSGKRIGIFGMGNIGQAIARRASGFDMEILYTDRYQPEGLTYQYCEDLLSLAKQSDFLVIAASGSADNNKVIDESVFDAMPNHAWLINIARGSLVDEVALIQALKQGNIAGAALDVYEDEPNVPQELINLDNVVLQPHVASATFETRQRMSDVVFENVAAFFNKQPLPNAIK